MRMFIHVGLQKTGTTALQELIFKKLDVHYIRFLDSAIRMKTLDDTKPVLLSNEDLAGIPVMLSPPWSSRIVIAENLRLLFPQAHIIVGLRDPMDWMKSMYKEMVRQGCSQSFDQFSGTFPKDMLEYDLYVAHLKRIFPSVYVFWYEDLLRDFEWVVQGICDFIGEPVPEYENQWLNRSLSNNQVFGCRLLNKFVPRGMMSTALRIVRRDGNRD